MSTRRRISRILKEKGLSATLVYDGSGVSADDYGWWTITFDQETAKFLTSQDWSGVIEISDLDAGFEELAELPTRLGDIPDA
ncbi:hypothetical protein HOU72_gp20 [Pectobacterium phage Khlen]|uniref:Uncharacterized protein n=18 Tax=Phimunavirus TaxID=2560202 RepID=A0A1P7WFV2_9CAUD|nr:hypothetical protein BI050_gp26 [Pectobacterium phage PP90]YP_009591947.1 hypothetical protein FDG64_gp24 [Pectobacterium phage PhiM1]YP_009625544.1 hypothetical protein FDJ56_gp32 [Pectobacterium phage vB_PatP_CB5]YP_009811839.1 hypothetical protein HOU11_gp31 [Pectobacterium phage Gaspode]YP_009811949.1 hypothetical protein HOU13_gp29 [Pectobacterium phage Lelidair]YP_009812109.1 hypothetical protein HOU16_gp26 [Pectobacterium phage Nobby]YP_009817177.1 hypothetical protein HOU72_gp20 [P